MCAGKVAAVGGDARTALDVCRRAVETVESESRRQLKLGMSPPPVPHTHPFNSRFSGTTRVSWYQIGKTNLDFTEARDSEWQWHQLCHMQVCTSLQTDNHASTPPLSFLQAGCPSCRPTNSVKALRSVCVPQCRCGRGYCSQTCLSEQSESH